MTNTPREQSDEAPDSKSANTESASSGQPHINFGEIRIQSASSDQPQIIVGEMRIPVDFDPTKTTSRFSKAGVNWFLEGRYFLGLSTNPDTGQLQLEEIFDSISRECEYLISNSAFKNLFNTEDKAQINGASEILSQSSNTPEFWSFLAWSSCEIAKSALAASDTRRGMWAISVLHAARSMLIYKQSIESSMWRGYATALMRSVLDIWINNKEQSDEEFWQKTLTDNSLILSQLFSFPILILKEKAYLGGKGIENAGGKITDFLITNQLTQNVALIEIKTPKTRLLETSEYRGGVYAVSKELAGVVNQVLSYKDTLSTEFLSLRHNSTETFHAFNPQCLVLAGNNGEELTTHSQRRSFELYRNSLKDIQVITFDEVFAKLEALLKHLGV